MSGRMLAIAPVLGALVLLSGCLRPDGAIIDRLVIGEVLMNSEFAGNLRTLCTPGGRLSGSANGHQAERFVAEKLREFGLANVHFEPFEMPGWQVNETKITALTDPPLELSHPVALWNTASTPPDGITAELIDAGEGTEEELARLGDSVSGKFILVRGRKASRKQKMQLARDAGACGVLYAGAPDREPIIGGCHSELRPEPGIAIRHDDGEKLAAVLAEGTVVALNVKVQADVWDARPNNVVGDLPGHGPVAHEIVILGAHLDSWHLGEGAIDNGNGSATILETARALAAIGWKPRRTVRFVWFMGEEQNLFGSKAYVAAHSDELDDVIAVVNIDMPGLPTRLATFGHPEIVEFLESVGSQLRGYELSEEIGNYNWTGSDHAPFMDAGVCAVTLSGKLGDGGVNYHTFNDTYDCVDRRGTVQSAAVLGVLVRQLADAPERPSRRLPPEEE